jgi:gamma-glutamyltranspeptidase/glutathione hydrolase
MAILPILSCEELSMFRLILAATAITLVSAPVSAGAKPRPIHHETRSVTGPVEPLIAAAEPVAVKAGMDVLKRGGTAADAAVTIQTVLGLIEPQSSGLGGGSFMLYYDAKSGQITDYTGRETAPAGATLDMFLGSDGKPLSFFAAIVSGRATGVPGAMFMLDQAQKDHGKLAWGTLFTAAEGLADKGFIVTPRLGNYLQNVNFPQKHTPDFVAYFGDGQGGFRKAGDTLKNPAYARTLRTFAKLRGDAFRKGALAEAIVAKTHEAPLPGTMTLKDIADYKVGVRTSLPYVATTSYATRPLCAPYHVYIVCTTNVPSGGVALLQGLRIAEKLPFAEWGVHDPRAWQALIETERLMYADRDQYVGDTPDFMKAESGYLDAGYAAARAAAIKIGQVNPTPTAGTLPMTAGPDKTPEPGGTSHFVIRDTWGNVLSMTTTVESYFGTGRMAGGFFLNNQLTDFSFSPTQADGMPAANAVKGGKHPRSSMAPVIVFAQDGKTVVAAMGSPGGTSILAYNLKTLIGVLDWKLPMQQAIDLPNVVARGTSIRIERQRLEPAVWDALTQMGYVLTPLEGEESGLNGFILPGDGTVNGGSDPRREGVFVRGGQ